MQLRVRSCSTGTWRSLGAWVQVVPCLAELSWDCCGQIRVFPVLQPCPLHLVRPHHLALTELQAALPNSLDVFLQLTEACKSFARVLSQPGHENFLGLAAYPHEQKPVLLGLRTLQRLASCSSGHGRPKPSPATWHTPHLLPLRTWACTALLH